MDERFGRHPGVGTNVNRLGDKNKAGRIVVVRARDQMSALRDNCPVADRNLALGVERDAARYGALIGQLQVPGGPNCGTWIHMHASAYFGPETP